MFVNTFLKKKEQVLFFSRQQEIEVSEDVDNTYKELCESIQQYVDGGFNKADITTNKYPNSWTQGDEMPKVRFRQIFNIQVDNIFYFSYNYYVNFM